MNEVMSELLVFIMLALIAVLAVVAKATRQPYPVVFLLGGIALALVPGIPSVTLDPELVFLVFLPPLIFGDGYVTDWRDFKRYVQPITLLATGLVIATSVSVAYVAHWLIGLPMSVGFVLGAILSPTDTVATDAIAEETGMPRRLEIILGGESLVNDATGLVLYKFAVAAVLVGSFSFGAALAQFAYVAIVGVAIGIIGGELILRATHFLNDHDLIDDPISVTITLVTPFVLYILADRVGASGVLAAAAGGLYVGRKGGGFSTADSRIIGRGVWNTLFFLFNGALFIILGLQLRATFIELQIFPIATLAEYAAGISLTVIVSRLVWVFIIARLRRWFDPTTSAREGPVPPKSYTFILGWAGMRGIVSLAAALALPTEMIPGVPFPARDLILFITFAVIVVTLIGQGTTLPWLMRKLNVVDADDTAKERTALARVRTAEAGLRRLVQLEPSFVSPTHWEVAGKLRAQYEDRMAHYQTHLDGTLAEGDAHQHDIGRLLSRETLAAERNALAEMRRVGEIDDAVYRRQQYDIDLAESRLT
jgi:CPA1 family monovalent cation:H+ antiporter